MPEAAHGPGRAGGAKRRGIDGAEHSAILRDVMARNAPHSATILLRTVQFERY